MSRMNSYKRTIFYKMLAERDGETCNVCEKPGNTKTLIVDHIDNNNSNNNALNLQLLCRSCNNRKNPRGKGKKQSHVYIRGDEHELPKMPSPEMKKNQECEPVFREWLMKNMVKLRKMSTTDILDAGAEKAGCSQSTINRYLKKVCSFEGKYIVFKEGEEKYVKFNPEYETSIRKEEEMKNEVPENVLQLPKQAAVNETG